MPDVSEPEPEEPKEPSVDVKACILCQLFYELHGDLVAEIAARAEEKFGVDQDLATAAYLESFHNKGHVEDINLKENKDG